MSCSVFVGCSTESLPIAREIERILGPCCTVKVWDKLGNVVVAGQHFFDSILAGASGFDFAIFIFTPEAKVIDRNAQFTAPRDNLLFELGIFSHAIGKERTFILREQVNGVRLPSDLLGFNYVGFRWEKAGETQSSLQAALQHIADRIKSLGRRDQVLNGKRLFQHAGYYPIALGKDRKPGFVKETFFKALRFFRHEKYDQLAATDLSYLWEANRVHLDVHFSDQEEAEYLEFVRYYDIEQFMKHHKSDHERIFKNYARIVDDLGATLKDCCFEILLHDVRNPLRSIIAAQNSDKISGRRKNDPSTRFVIEYLNHQGRGLLDAFDTGDLVAYLKQFEIGKVVKASTIPIFHWRYGLVGIICINIDLDLVRSASASAEVAKAFFEAFARNSGITPKFEQVNLGDFAPAAGPPTVVGPRVAQRNRLRRAMRRLARAASRMAASLLF